MMMSSVWDALGTGPSNSELRYNSLYETLYMKPSKALDLYRRHYQGKDSGSSELLTVFQKTRAAFNCQRVLYPGCYLHITPSLVFPSVCYVDSLKGIAQAMSDTALLEYINRHKLYPERADIWCHAEDYFHLSVEPMESFDLLISLNAGFISQACKKFLRRGELLLVNDGHYDASRAYVDPDFRLIGAFEGTELDLITSGEELSAYFRTSNGVHLTREMVEANALRPPSKARFKLTHRAEIYLFRKTHAAIPGLHDCEFGS